MVATAKGAGRPILSREGINYSRSDHWPNGFSLALAGGGIRGGTVVGATDPEGKADPTDKVTVPHLHATVLTAVGIDPGKLNQTPIGRTVKFSEGQPVAAVLRDRG